TPWPPTAPDYRHPNYSSPTERLLSFFLVKLTQMQPGLMFGCLDSQGGDALVVILLPAAFDGLRFARGQVLQELRPALEPFLIFTFQLWLGGERLADRIETLRQAARNRH